MIHASDDTNMRWEYGTFIRIVRVIGMLLSMLLPGLYLALVLFQPEVIPLGLLTSIMETHAKVPFPTVVEVLILVLSFDLIQESATRVPGVLGSTLGIVGALILGEAAVSADIISPILVIVIALTGLGNYAVPDYQFSIALRILRLLFIFAGASAGLFGLSLAAFFCTTYMCGMKSLGQPFLAPMAPYRPHNPDILLRLPLYCQRYRLFTATPAARRAAARARLEAERQSRRRQMKIARREFLSMYVVLAFTHVFCRIFLTEPLLVSSAWMPLLLAFIAALPPIMFARTLMGVKQPIAAVFDMALGRAGARIWYALALVMQLIGANIVTNLFSASVMAYANDIPIDRSIIVLTLAVEAGLGAYIGETALANCARITLRMAIPYWVEWRFMRFRRLMSGTSFRYLGRGAYYYRKYIAVVGCAYNADAVPVLRGNA